MVTLIIRGRNIGVSDMLAEHTRVRVARAMRRFFGQVEQVEAIFVDLNGPRGGARHAACRLIVDLGGGRPATVEARERDFYAAASAAARLIGGMVDEELARARREPPA